MTKASKYIRRIQLLASIALPGLLLSCNQNSETAAAPAKDSAQSDSVKVFVLAADSVKKTVTLPAELLPYENAQVRAKVQGYIRTLPVDIGSHVSKGQVLALIDAPEVSTHVQELNEKERAARARFNASKDYFDRISVAAHTDGVIAPLELQKVKSQMEADSSEYNAAALAAKSYRQVGNYLAVLAPYSGTVTKRNVVVGSFVGIATDKPLFELENNTTLRLQVAVPEVYTNAVLLNNSAELSTRSLPDKKFKAALVRKAGSIASDTRSELWEFGIPNPNGLLKAGSYADVKLQLLRPGLSLTAPASAIVTTQEKKFVIKVSGGATQWIDVRTGFNIGEKQEIFGDLKAGDTLVLKASEELKAGTAIVPKL